MPEAKKPEATFDPKLKQVKEFVPINLPISSILIDEKFNVRKVYDDEEIKNLAADIKLRGQMTPVMVQPRPGDSKNPYRLIVGFRRLRALQSVGATSVLAEVFDGDDFSAQCANIAENVQRENLLPYELAGQLVKMREQYKVDGGKLGRLVGVSKNYANNLMRLEDKLCPKLLRLFHHDDPSAHDPGVTELLKYAPLTHEEQEKEWEKRLGTASHKGKGEPEQKEPEAKKDEKHPFDRPSTHEIDTALVNLLALVDGGKVSRENAKIGIAALQWAGGAKASIPGVYSKADEEKKVEAEKEAKKKAAEDEKEAKRLIREQEATAKKAEAEKLRAIEKAKTEAEKAKAAAEKAKAAEAEAKKLAGK